MNHTHTRLVYVYSHKPLCWDWLFVILNAVNKPSDFDLLFCSVFLMYFFLRIYFRYGWLCAVLFEKLKKKMCFVIYREFYPHSIFLLYLLFSSFCAMHFSTLYTSDNAPPIIFLSRKWKLLKGKLFLVLRFFYLDICLYLGFWFCLSACLSVWQMILIWYTLFRIIMFVLRDVWA